MGRPVSWSRSPRASSAFRNPKARCPGRAWWPRRFCVRSTMPRRSCAAPTIGSGVSSPAGHDTRSAFFTRCSTTTYGPSTLIRSWCPHVCVTNLQAMTYRLPGTKPNQYSNRCSIKVGTYAPHQPTGSRTMRRQFNPYTRSPRHPMGETHPTQAPSAGPSSASSFLWSDSSCG